ncbi:MAG: ribose-5-phosphate isomerase, partial [Acidimicrobiaceae bacterium]|nr:ribose-5-phosphate isomerase [Acidimicrobiaceae bacterium]
ERLIGPEVASEALRAWLDAEFEGGRHAGRVDKLSGLDGSLDRHAAD